MNRLAAAALVTLPLVLFGPASAASDVPLAPFSSVELNGGGHVTLHYGPTQRVTLVKGNLQVTRLSVVHGDTLHIDACDGNCPGSYELEIDIVSPKLTGFAIHGGGEIEALGSFSAQSVVAAAIHGGGEIDTRAIPADEADAAIHGGGHIRVKALHTLNAAIHGGGAITYTGAPQVNSAISGGGTVSKE